MKKPRSIYIVRFCGKKKRKYIYCKIRLTAQREYAARIVRAVEIHKTAFDFLTFTAALGSQGMGGGYNWSSLWAGSNGGWDGGDGVTISHDHVG